MKVFMVIIYFLQILPVLGNVEMKPVINILSLALFFTAIYHTYNWQDVTTSSTDVHVSTDHISRNLFHISYHLHY